MGISGNQLVVVDVDYSFNKLAEYLYQAAQVFRRTSSLSIKNINDMITLYEQMGHRPLPKVHPDVNMPHTLFHKLLKNYSESCTEAINILKGYGLDENMPSQLVNNIVHNSFERSYSAAVGRTSYSRRMLP